MASYGNGLNYLAGTGYWGILTVLLMNRAAAGTWLDSTPMTARPVRTLSWFFLGVSIAAFVNAARFRELGYDGKTYQLHTRVAQNEQTHTLLRNIKVHLQQRKMSVWDAAPSH